MISSLYADVIQLYADVIQPNKLMPYVFPKIDSASHMINEPLDWGIVKLVFPKFFPVLYCTLLFSLTAFIYNVFLTNFSEVVYF